MRQALNRELLERKERELYLQKIEKRTRAIFDLSFSFIGLLSPEGRVLDVNKSALNFIGLELGAVRNKFFWDTPWWDHSVETQSQVRRIITQATTKKKVMREETVHIALDGTQHIVDFTIRPVIDSQGNVELLIPEGHDITELKQAEFALQRQATMDMLTGLPNRYALMQEIEKRFERSPAEPFGFIQINISNYSAVVSAFGDDVADEYLRRVSSQIEHDIREKNINGFIARPTGYAGICILVDTSAQTLLEQIIKSVLAVYKKYVKIGNTEISSTVFVGVCLSQYAQNTQDILQKTTLAMQTAKTMPPNVICFYDVHLMTKQKELIELEHQLALAIENKDFVPHYQPQVTSSGRLIGYEALARWHRLDGKVLSPGVFIGPLSRLNLLQELFEVMLKKFARIWIDCRWMIVFFQLMFHQYSFLIQPSWGILSI